MLLINWFLVLIDPNVDLQYIKSKVKEMPISKEDGEWQCSKCGKRLTSKRNLQRHKDKKNNCNETVVATVVDQLDGTKVFECSECGKQFFFEIKFYTA